MAELIVERAGLATTLQDLGRVGFLKIGVPGAGALDRSALAVANALAGAPPGAAALEIRLLGPSLRATAPTRLALAGAAAELTLTRAGSGAVERVAVGPALWRSVTLAAGDGLAVGALAGSATAYLAVAGGFSAPAVFGSVATHGRGRLGGFQGDGRGVADGDRLLLRDAAGAAAAAVSGDRALASPELWPSLDAPIRARATLGPQQNRFTEATLARFFAETWTVSKDADRMGLRLAGAPLPHQGDGADIVSEGLARGAVQVPGAGLPILLLSDRQTAGGYAKIATVIGPDLDTLGRARPGDRIRFEPIGAAEAVAAARAAAARLDAALRRIRPLGDGLDLARLYSENLITAQAADDED